MIQAAGLLGVLLIAAGDAEALPRVKPQAKIQVVRVRPQDPSNSSYGSLVARMPGWIPQRMPWRLKLAAWRLDGAIRRLKDAAWKCIVAESYIK